MKTAIYINDGRTQLVLTPESDFEKGVVGRIDKGEHAVKIYTGEFYDCQGGWTRQRAVFNTFGRNQEESLIIVMGIKEEE